MRMRTFCLPALLAVLAFCQNPAAGQEQTKDDFMTPAAQDSLGQIRQSMPRWTSVNMEISASQYQQRRRYSISDPFLRMSMTGDQESDGSFSFSGDAAGQYLSFSISTEPKGGYNIFGGGLNLWLKRAGGYYMLSGFVGRHNIWLQITPRGGSYTVLGQMGLSVSVSGTADNTRVDGSTDLDHFDSADLAVLGATLCALNSPPPTK